MNKQLKIAIIGAAGQQGQEYYKLLHGDAITTLVDSDFVKLSQIYSGEANVKLFSSIEEASGSSDFNTAIVCLPHHLHAEVALYLLRRNKVVIKEKPLALSTSDIESYKELSDFTVLTTVQRAFNSVFKNAKNDLAILGRIYSYKYEYNLNIPEQTTGWRARLEYSGGGVLIDMGYHILDVVISFFGIPQKTTGFLSYCYEDMSKAQLEDSACVVLSHFSEQIQGIVSLSRHHSQRKEEFEILGHDGTMLINPKGYKILNRQNQVVKEFLLEDSSSQIKRSMLECYLNLCDCKDFTTSHFAHHSAIVSIIENVYRASKKENTQ